MKRPILTLDFDGVIHGYQSGWKGAAVIPDPPVPGALEFIVRALGRFDVAVHSSRSHQWGGRAAMQRYLRAQYVALGWLKDVPSWWMDRVCDESSMEPWSTTNREAAERIVRTIRWPIFKPPSMVSIDDRGLTFTGAWPDLDELAAFKPWNKRT